MSDQAQTGPIALSGVEADSEAVRILQSAGYAVEIAAKPRRDDGELIAARAEAERRIAETEAVFSAQNDAVLIYDLQMNVSRANPAFIRDFGFDPVGMNVSEIIRRVCCRSLDGRPIVWEEQPTPRALRGERVSGVFFIVTKGDGSEAVVSTTSGPILVGDRITGSVTVWHDITERRRAEEELQRQRDLLTTVAENTDAQLVYLDRDFNFIWVNPAYAKACAKAPEEFVGHNHFEFYPHQENQAIFERVRDTGVPFEAKEKPFEFPDHPEWGTTYWNWTLTPIRDGEGITRNLVFSLIDVTRDVLARHEIERLSAEAEQERLELYEREHRIAQVLQEAIMPPDLPMEMMGYRIGARYRPALQEAQIGGDFYDIFDLGDGKFGVVIGDVTGKGLPAAMRVASARYALRSYAYIDPRPARVMDLVNDALCRDSGDEIRMLTALFAVIDSNVGILTYASAGHEPPVICNPRGLCQTMEFGGIPLGVIREGGYSQTSRRLDVGDTIILFTDGITEARRDGSVLFGKRHLMETIHQTIEGTPGEIATALMSAAAAHAGGSLQDDAATVVVRYEWRANG